MKQQSSLKYRFNRLDKPFSSRKIMFPSNTFIELTLSPSQVRKVKRWMKDDDSVIPMWFHTCERVLFLNEAKFEAWERKKKR